MIQVPNSEGDWLRRTQLVSERFYKLLGEQPGCIGKVYIEYPGYHASAGGVASATRGDVFKLMMLVGCLAQQCWTFGCEFVPVPVNDWKGTLSKEAVMTRIKNVLGREYPNHTADAVGIGLHLRGMLDSTGKIRLKGER